MKIAVIGLGFMGATHLKALRNIPEAEVVAVASDDPRALSGDLTAVGGNLGAVGAAWDFSAFRKYSNYADAVKDPEAEAVDICLPTHLHAPAALAALKAKKHVLVEKPMALTGAEADQMLAAAESSGRILMTAQVLRFFPAYLALADAVRNGMLGQVRSALFRRRCAAPGWSAWLTDPLQSGGGVFDLLIHDIDQCLWLFGLPEAVSATGYVNLPQGVDTIVATLYYPEIGSVVVTGGWHHPKAYPFSMEYTVVCEGGTVEYSSAGKPPSLYAADGTETALPQPQRDGYEAEIAYFIECCIKNRKPDRCPPQESALAVKLTRLIVEAREKKGEKVPCNL
jgi:predicted dehydrogenase